ncbi:MAG: dephospho-CoA kinase [Oscillospiraceae bacterium]|nr:dephospho-CoA kinase [Oscillospiraceae bacterium]
MHDTAVRTCLVGLTGQTGAGKTTVSDVFAAHGFVVINADAIAREVVQPGSACLAEIADAFGTSLLRADGSLDRAQTAKLIFSDGDAKKRYESIIFPHITRAVFQVMDAYVAEGRRHILLDAPTLFESGLHTACDYVVSVVADEKVRLQRIMQRDGITAEAAAARMASQYTEDFFRSHADAVLQNHGTVSDLVAQAETLIVNLMNTN